MRLIMKLGFTWFAVGLFFLVLLVGLTSDAQQAGQATLPASGSVGAAQSGTPPASATQSTTGSTPTSSKGASAATTTPADTSADDNPYDPLLEPPPLPKGTTTLIGGIATSVDKVRNRMTVQPFGKGQRSKYSSTSARTSIATAPKPPCSAFTRATASTSIPC